MDFNLILSLSAHNIFCTSTCCWSRKSGTLVSYESWHLCLRKGAFTSLGRVGWVSEGDESGARCGAVLPPIVPPTTSQRQPPTGWSRCYHRQSTILATSNQRNLPLHTISDFGHICADILTSSMLLARTYTIHLQTSTNNLSPLKQTEMYAYQGSASDS